MTASRPEKQVPNPEDISTTQASTLLRLGLEKPRRPIDDLIDRLRQTPNESWLISALEAGPMRDVGGAIELLIEGRASVEQCNKIKEQSKSLVRQRNDAEKYLAGLAGYFLAVAAALTHHGVLRSTGDRDDLADALFDLAAVAPARFSKLLSEAAQAVAPN